VTAAPARLPEMEVASINGYCFWSFVLFWRSSVKVKAGLSWSVNTPVVNFSDVANVLSSFISNPAVPRKSRFGMLTMTAPLFTIRPVFVMHNVPVPAKLL